MKLGITHHRSSAVSRRIAAILQPVPDVLVLVAGVGMLLLAVWVGL
jgi:uncharacterized membrane protein SirB2